MTSFSRLNPKTLVIAVSIAVALGLYAFIVPRHAELEIADVELAQWDNDQTSHPEPSIAVNPTDTKTIAIIALRLGYSPTEEEGFCGSKYGGLIITLDGGASWSKRCTFPKEPSNVLGDASVDFTGDGTTLLASYLSPPGDPQVKRVHGWVDASTTHAVGVSLGSSEFADMPFTVASAQPGTQIFSVGTFQDVAIDACPGGGLIYWWNDKGGYGSPCVSMRPGLVLTVRTAHSNDGMFYGLFFNVRDATDKSDLVLVRDRLANSPFSNPTFTAFTDDVLLDPSPPSGSCAVPDGMMGQRLKNCTAEVEDDGPCYGLGYQVRNPNQIALAIDPSDSRTVYYAYGDIPTGQPFTLHLAKFSDATGTRQVTELLSIPDALNPSVVVTPSGRVAFAYQQHAGGTWQTFLRTAQRDEWLWGTFALTEASPDTQPGIACGSTSPYLGDYADMVAVGEDIYGTFSFDNNPTYNPNAKYFRDKTLLGGSVPYSVDPFYFHVSFPLPRYRVFVAEMKIFTVSAMERIKNLLRIRPLPAVPHDTLPPPKGAKR